MDSLASACAEGNISQTKHFLVRMIHSRDHFCSSLIDPRRRIFQGFYSFPSDVLKLIIDPLTTVDIVVPQCTVEFKFFRIRGAGLIRQVYTRVHQEHQKFNDNYPGPLQDIILDILLQGLSSSLDSHESVEL
jgi:hypothetical protein